MARLVPGAILLLTLAPMTSAFAADSKAQGKAAAPAAVRVEPAKPKPIVHFALHLSRTETPPWPTTPEGIVSDAAATLPASDSSAGKASKSGKPAPAPPAPPQPPLTGVLASPSLSTVDGDTASISLSAPNALSYNIALSPASGSANNTVQVLWNVRLSGKSLPGGTSSVTLTGATQMTLGSEGLITEIVLTDAEGKRTSTFRLTGTVTRETDSSSAAADIADRNREAIAAVQ